MHWYNCVYVCVQVFCCFSIRIFACIFNLFCTLNVCLHTLSQILNLKVFFSLMIRFVLGKTDLVSNDALNLQG